MTGIVTRLRKEIAHSRRASCNLCISRCPMHYSPNNPLAGGPNKFRLLALIFRTNLLHTQHNCWRHLLRLYVTFWSLTLRPHHTNWQLPMVLHMIEAANMAIVPYITIALNKFSQTICFTPCIHHVHDKVNLRLLYLLCQHQRSLLKRNQYSFTNPTQSSTPFSSIPLHFGY